MPGIRKKGKEMVGGYMSAPVIEAIKKVRDLDVTSILEIAITRELIKRGYFTPAKVRELSVNGDIKDSTIAALAREKII